MTEPTEKEMEKHCEKYACRECPLNERCPMFKELFKWRGER
jgi:hypothetical protein